MLSHWDRSSVAARHSQTCNAVDFETFHTAIHIPNTLNECRWLSMAVCCEGSLQFLELRDKLHSCFSTGLLVEVL